MAQELTKAREFSKSARSDGTMNDKKLRVLLLCAHPTQYSSPMWRLIAQRPEMDVLVAYCSLQVAESSGTIYMKCLHKDIQ